jgi:hypothetical protein
MVNKSKLSKINQTDDAPVQKYVPLPGDNEEPEKKPEEEALVPAE